MSVRDDAHSVSGDSSTAGSGCEPVAVRDSVLLSAVQHDSCGDEDSVACRLGQKVEYQGR